MIFDLQLFAEQLDMSGIDEDILKELGVEDEPSSESKDEEQQEEQPQEQPAEQIPDGEADTDNKQVVEEAQEDEEVKEGQTIPYDRFKSVNERRKTAENRIKELEEQLKALQSQPKPVEQPVQVQNPVPTVKDDYSPEQRKQIGEIAVDRVKKKFGYTDEDVEALEYADDISAKLAYQAAIIQEMQIINKDIETFKVNQQREKDMYSQNVERFNQLNAKVAAYPDAQARIQFILNDNFNKLDAEKQAILQEAYQRLQQKRGTNTDFRLINSYITKSNRLWDEAHNTPQPQNTTLNKITKAQKLPKAPNINGGGGNDKVYTIAELTELINSKDGWDSLPQKVKDQIMKGNMPV